MFLAWITDTVSQYDRTLGTGNDGNDANSAKSAGNIHEGGSQLRQRG